jgi:hypothetical protein
MISTSYSNFYRKEGDTTGLAKGEGVFMHTLGISLVLNSSMSSLLSPLKISFFIMKGLVKNNE